MSLCWYVALKCTQGQCIPWKAPQSKGKNHKYFHMHFPARTHSRTLQSPPQRSQRAEQPCSEGRFYHCQERQEFLLLSTSLQACWFSVTDFSEIVRVFPDVENLKLCVRWTNRMYSLLLLLCLVTSLHLK